MPQVSVIIPTFNRAHTLGRAIESVLNQTHLDWELLVVDDGSTDNTDEVVQKTAQNNQTAPHKIHYFNLPTNRGVSHARNWGAQRAQGEWLAFLDSDDIWLPHKLEQQLKLAVPTANGARPERPLIHSDEIWIRNGKRVTPKRHHKKSGERVFTRCVDICCISPSTTMIHTSTFHELGGFREEFKVCEDYDLWLRLCARYSVAYCEEPLVIKHGGHADQLSYQYKAMDEFRVKALLDILDEPSLSEFERDYAKQSIAKKIEILRRGFHKYGHIQKVQELDQITAKLNLSSPNLA